jgi:signal transduction histidine kinase
VITSQIEPTRRLADFLRTHRTPIIGEWAKRVKQLTRARQLSENALIDHLPGILDRIADAVEASGAAESPALGGLPDDHAVDRLARGFDLDQIVEEYALLRRAILDLWEMEGGTIIDVTELRKLEAAFDESITQSTLRYAKARERLLKALDRVSAAALGSADLEVFLHDLLHATLEGTESVDTGVVLLREGDVLRVRAAVGLEEELERTYSVTMGEGFAGHVAQVGRPVFLPDASTSPVVKSPVIRGKGIRALYGVPLMREGKAIGVAHIGSLTASEFSDEDKLLFRMIVSRATAGVVKAQILADLRRAEAAQRFLSDASRELALSLDYDATLAKIAHFAVPVIADWCVVDLLEGTTLRRVSVAHADPEKEILAAELERRYPTDLNAATGVANVLRTGVAEWAPDITEDALAAAARDSTHLEALRQLGLKSYIVAPIVSHERVLGTIALVTAESRRRYSDSDLRLAEDLGRRVGMALENARLYREAQEAIAVRERVLAVVSHDLRNQLGVLTTAARVLERHADASGVAEGGDARKTIDRMQRTTAGMQRLVDDLLDMSSIQAGRLSLNRTAQALRPVLKEACESFQAVAHEKGVRLTIPPHVSDDIRVVCDCDRILQALGNLLGNAVKYCKAGDEVTLDAREDATDVVVSVRDTGPGIPADEVETIFDAYRTMERRGTTGTGLGLYITKRIVERHGGRLWVESQPGIGSTFSFTLPRAV